MSARSGATARPQAGLAALTGRPARDHRQPPPRQELLRQIEAALALAGRVEALLDAAERAVYGGRTLWERFADEQLAAWSATYRRHYGLVLYARDLETARRALTGLLARAELARLGPLDPALAGRLGLLALPAGAVPVAPVDPAAAPAAAQPAVAAGGGAAPAGGAGVRFVSAVPATAATAGVVQGTRPPGGRDAARAGAREEVGHGRA